MMERALLVTVVQPGRSGLWHPDDSRKELCDLAVSAGLHPAEEHVVINRYQKAGTLIGSGKVLEFSGMVKKHRLNVVVFSHDLTPSQQRNLETALECKTIDRTQLILDIFARRAKSLEGKVQVELAQLNYLLPRLSGRGVLLSRLGGGIGTRGPGEQKLEMDRRRIRQRIQHLKKDLRSISKRRAFNRLKRSQEGLPAIAIVGYTNGGKSTLFNALTSAHVGVHERLFSTLDPTIRRLTLPNRQRVLLIDTVGFLNLLPHHLIDAFKATLEEVSEADLLLHVIDVSRSDGVLVEKAVREVLNLLGAQSKKVITVLNKVDKIADQKSLLQSKKGQWPDGVFLSALQRLELEALTKRIQEAFSERRQEVELFIPFTQRECISAVYNQGEVVDRKDQTDGIYFKAFLPYETIQYIKRKVAGEPKSE